ncbi:MAG: anhydro-N-acetylmuramic acid kinase [Ferruginibacter sp.]
MKRDIDKLYSISKKKTRRIIGLMSGTSLDGLDIAVCSITGSGSETKLVLEKFKTFLYETDIKNEIRGIFSRKDADLEKVCLLNEWIAVKHAKMINESLTEWKIAAEEIDIIASHGQTIYHAPKHQHHNKKFGNATLQIGDGDHIAVNTGIITISDFRQKHIAGGGEGAPLAAYGDRILFSDPEKDTLLLNIGGIANFTFLPAKISSQKMFSTDVGPGNTLMDAWMQRNFPGSSFDKDAEVALQGTVHQELLEALLNNPFFLLDFPKTTGPELFNLSYLENAMNTLPEKNIPAADVMATLNVFTATVIVNSIKKIQQEGTSLDILISGGGIHNPLLLRYLKKNSEPALLRSTAEKNIDPDAKEAILFALLANECVAGNNDTFKDLFPNVSMGKISFPT